MSSAAMRTPARFTRLDDATDAELLERFVADRDGEAFTALVHRHGPMVFGVCRRVLRDWHLAEDAFQAAFVVLARKAAAIFPPGAVAGWLHGVAYRVANDARRSALRRMHRERPAEMLPEPFAQPLPDSAELAGMLDHELQKLPGKYRQLLVACDLEGRPRQPVAEALGIPEGTLSSRLTTARKMLAARLTKRGLAPAIVAGIAANGPSVIACEVPPALSASAARIGSAVPGTVPASITALASGAIRAMTIRTYLPWAAGLLIVASAALGFAATRPEPQPAETPDTPKPLLVLAASAEQVPAKAEAKPLPQGPNKILFYRSGYLMLIDPDGKNENKASQDAGKFHPGDARLSPDGKTLAVLHRLEEPVDGKQPRSTLHVRGLEEKEPGTSLGIECQMFFWSPDGTEIVYSDFEDGTDKKLESTHGIVNVKTKEKTAVKLPKGHMITDWSRDGKYFLTTSIDGVVTPDKFPTAKLHLMNRDGREFKELTDGKKPAVFGRLSPDGKRVLFMDMTTEQPMENPAPIRPVVHKLNVLDIATGKTTKVEDLPLNGEILGYCWSPDGKRIAYCWREVHKVDPKEAGTKETESSLVVCDPDGKNQKTIATEKGKGQWLITIGHIDWR